MAPFIKEKRLVLGGLLILIGIFLLADKFGYWFFPGWIFSWQMILIGVGIFSLLTADNPTPGIVMIAVGGFFLLNFHFYPIFHQVIRFWPAVFIIAGIVVIFSLSRHKKGKERYTAGGWGKFDASSALSNDDVLDEVAVFGGGSRKITTQNFKGGRLTAIFGGSEIDLTQASLAEGVNVLEVTAMFGGWELQVPSNWNLEIRITPIFGGFSDKRNISVSDPVDNTRKLVITGTAIFGGGEIKGYPSRK